MLIVPSNIGDWHITIYAFIAVRVRPLGFRVQVMIRVRFKVRVSFRVRVKISLKRYVPIADIQCHLSMLSIPAAYLYNLYINALHPEHWYSTVYCIHLKKIDTP